MVKIKSSHNVNTAQAKITDPNRCPWRLRRCTDVSASSNLLPVEEFFCNRFGSGLIGGDLRIKLLLVCEIVGKSRMHAGGREMLVLADDIFSAVAEMVQDRYSVNVDSHTPVLDN